VTAPRSPEGGGHHTEHELPHIKCHVCADETARAIAHWLLDARFTKPGREAEWSRFLAQQIIDGKWKP
jgi:hypothetical protein